MIHLKPIYVTKKTLPNNVAGDFNSSDNDENILIYIGTESFSLIILDLFNDDFLNLWYNILDDDNDDDVDNVNDDTFTRNVEITKIINIINITSYNL